MQDYPGQNYGLIMNNYCPSHYGYEKENSCCEKLYCSECWNREVSVPNKLTIQEAINVMQKYTMEPISPVVIEAHQMAISALENMIEV